MVRKGENIYKRKDGRWEGRYIKRRKLDGSIHYGYLYSHSYDELKQELLIMKVLHQKQYSHHIPNHTWTVAQWSEKWLALVQQRVKQSTYVNYVNKLKNHFVPLLGNLHLAKVKEEDIRCWMKKLEEKLNPNSIRTVFQVVKSCFEDAVKTRVLLANPCKEVAPPKTAKKFVKALSVQEQTCLYRYALSDPQGLAIIFALDSGLRIGEIAGLKWSDIDFSEKVVTVRRTVQRLQTFDAINQRKTRLIESVPKSRSSERVVPLSSNLISLLKQQKETVGGTYMLCGEKSCDPRLISYWFKRICAKAGIRPTCFHALRHSFATRCIESGVTIATISSLLGHSSIKMTLDTYISSFLSEKRRAIQMVSTEI